MDIQNKIATGALIVAFLSLALSIVTTVKSCYSSKIQQETNYRLSSIEHRPRVKFCDPYIYALNFKIDSLPLKTSFDEKDSIGDTSTNLTFKSKIKYTNIGNSNAQLLAIIIADTLSNDMMLKEKLDDIVSNKNGNSNDINIPYTHIDLSPSDTTFIDYVHTVQFISNNTFTIHVLALYKNELNQLFDTYYWIRYQTNDIIFDNPFYSKYSYKRFMSDKDKFWNSVEYKDENNYSSVYSKDKSSQIIELIKE